ncbi:DUF1801 domain-containing protein [Penaeicola halotolerans]|uniref:DUF1801 domain-containing protein n=1 Tax=Penaeicola halotolerans TaxID=2793196 RepID=UPI001CF88644|nr:DUF1801 domain-containing protein [Penaeicola halotolerans]
MTSTIKTKQTNASVLDFIKAAADTPQKLTDSLTILKLMEEVTGYPAKMWGESIIGFGQYHYKSDRSRQEGDWPLVGFSPRKAAISLYVYSGCAGQEDLLAKLGKYKMGKSCIYVKRLSDIDQKVLVNIIQTTISFLRNKYPD